MTHWVELPVGSADELAERLTQVLRAAAREEQVVVAVDAAAGALDLPGPAGQRGWERTVWAPLSQRLRSSQTAVLLLARGRVSGLGLALCLTVDLCVCEEDATFTAGQAGALSGGVAWHLRRHGGPKLAARLMLAGQQLSAAQAVDAGIVTDTGPASSLRPTAETLLTPLQHEELPRLLLRSYRHAAHLELADSVDYDTRLVEVAHSGT
jgi:enoyl-CoA hydratase/carnithine racemase